ncbi:MAG: YfcE family phosphodiesterase [Anaerolineaceae bacterium]|nr:YfcE family phosphodiesterase [Anaerolineaceae bacterium]
MQKPKSITLGIVSDTHIPDRMPSLPKELLIQLENKGVDGILHAGDVCSQSVLDQLAEIAPVHAVQGNRDWLYGFKLPKALDLTFNGVKLTLTHGHISIPFYFVDKFYYMLNGFRFDRSHSNLAKRHPDSKIIVFGHTHRQVCTQANGRWFFNPGATYPCLFNNHNPQYGFLTIDQDGEITSELRSLNQ